MKNSVLIVAFVGLVTLALQAQQPPAPPAAPALSAPAPAAPATNIGPKIKFETPMYDFGRVQSGSLVKHTYVFTNVGDEALEIKGVQPQCGCTAANDWTKRVEPGQSGTISIQFNSANYNGGVLKNVTVTSTDRTQPQTVLQLKGLLWKPIDVNPIYAVLNVGPDAEKTSTTVRIINNTDEPLTLSSPQCNNRNFGVEVAEVPTNKPGKEFIMTVSTLPPLTQGTISGQISVKTSSTNVPVLNVSAIAIVQSPLVVAPPQIRLPQGPLPNVLTNSFTIQNNSTNSLKLSDATASAKGVDVEIKETQPGKLFTALVAFPQGFETVPGQPVTVTIKSSNPRVPVIKVPVEQPSRPSAMQTLPAAALSAKSQAAAH